MRASCEKRILVEPRLEDLIISVSSELFYGEYSDFDVLKFNLKQ